MVAPVRAGVERHLSHESSGDRRGAPGGDALRCIWELGLRSDVEGQVVPNKMERDHWGQGLEHNAQGAAANSGSSSGVGQALEGVSYHGQVRQHGGGGIHQIRCMQGEKGHVPDEVSGLRRGKGQ